MELIITACSHEHMLTLLKKDIDAIVIGESKLSLRLAYTYEKTELYDAITTIKKANKKVIIDMHTMVDNALLPYAEEILQQLQTLEVDGIIYSDPAIYALAQAIQCKHPLIWSTETTATNWFAVEYWAQKGIQHVVLAKELTKDAIASINQNIKNPDVALEIQAFGPLNMFHSRRNLLNNYYQHLELTDAKNGNEQQFLFDRERNNYYPIFEDASGTHIMSPKDVCLVDEFEFFASCQHIKYLRIDALGHPIAFMDEVIDTFIIANKTFAENPENYFQNKESYSKKIANLYEGNHRTMDKGFFYKPTIY